VAKLGQQTSHVLIAQDARIQRLEEQTQKKEAVDQETLASLRAKVEALTEDLVKAWEEIKQVKSAQDLHDVKLSEAEITTQQTLNILRGDFRTLHEDLDQVQNQCIGLEYSRLIIGC
jgi:hypothetical protein